MKKILTYTVFGLMAISIGILSIYCHHLRTSSSDESSSVPTKIDTVYVSDFFLKSPDLEIKHFPSRIFFFFTDTTEVEKTLVIRDTLKITEKDSTNLYFNTNFLTQYPEASKLLQMNLSERRFEIALLNVQGQVYKETYSVDTRFSKYQYTDHLTSDRISFWSRLQPFAQIQIRPIHNFWDLDLGLSYNTTKINYELGINGFYYPGIHKTPGADIFLRVRYNF